MTNVDQRIRDAMRNPLPLRDLSGWLVVAQHGRTLIGKPVQKTIDGQVEDWLDPGYDYFGNLHQSPDGRNAINYVVLPILMLPSWTSVRLSKDAMIKPVSELRRKEYEALTRAVSGGEDMIARMQRGASGIEVPDDVG